jgi:hypothetical protein
MLVDVIMLSCAQTPISINRKTIDPLLSNTSCHKSFANSQLHKLGLKWHQITPHFSHEKNVHVQKQRIGMPEQNSDIENIADAGYIHVKISDALRKFEMQDIVHFPDTPD